MFQESQYALGYAAPQHYVIGETISSPDDTGQVLIDQSGHIVIGPPPANSALGAYKVPYKNFPYHLGHGLGEMSNFAKASFLAAVVAGLGFTWWMMTKKGGIAERVFAR